VICAALWPDPADPQCPQAFVRKAREQMLACTTHERQKLFSEESRKRFEKARKNSALFEDVGELRGALLDFIADFANWDNSTIREYLDTSRALTQAAHEALGGAPSTRPLVVDPFAGGGSIPLEALRVGADTFVSDLNPVAVLLNRIIVEYGLNDIIEIRNEFRRAAAEVERWTRNFLAPAFWNSSDAKPIAYIWARAIECEGPACGAQIPLLRTLRLSKQGKTSAWLKFKVSRERLPPRIDIDVIQQEGPTGTGTVKNGSAVCPVCDYATKSEAVRAQLAKRRGGSVDARLVAVLERLSSDNKAFRPPNVNDLNALNRIPALLEQLEREGDIRIALIPDEPIPTQRPSPNARGLSAVTRVGMQTFGDLYSARQALVLSALAHAVRAATAVLQKANSRHTDVINALL
jgi:adenine-specific DNA methylase